MKHMKINGQLLNMEKTWRHLSMRQREWIVNQFREEYIASLTKNGTHPSKEECREIVDRVYGKIQDHGIWIPYGEVKRAFSSKLSRYRKIELATNS